MTRRRTTAWLVLAIVALTLPGHWMTHVVAAQGDGTDVRPWTPEAERPQQAGQAGILPDQRVLSYYGFPGNPLMGILGEYEMEALYGRLQDQAAEYEAADPSRPVKLAFEIIATVAQRDPMDNGQYIAYTDDEIIQQYVDFTAERDMLLILDVQFGLSSVEEQIDSVREWLTIPHVHIALDPEFLVQPGEQPGVDLGSIEGSDVTYAQEEMAQLAREAGIPPKILIVHQFNVFMIDNKEVIAPVDGVQLVIDADGWGPPADKQASYEVVITQEPIEFHGVKLFYRQDDPMMSAADILALEPTPDLVIYQ
ncbi:MAG: hypothetical protein ACRDJH_01450 [Thermomicrobiales bacterium]